MGLVSAGSIAGPVFGALGGWTSPEFAFSLIALLGAVATVGHDHGPDRPRGAADARHAPRPDARRSATRS